MLRVVLALNTAFKHKLVCDDELAKVCESMQTDSEIVDKTDCCTDVDDDLSRTDMKGLYDQRDKLNQEIQVRITKRQEMRDEFWQSMNKYSDCANAVHANCVEDTSEATEKEDLEADIAKISREVELLEGQFTERSKEMNKCFRESLDDCRVVTDHLGNTAAKLQQDLEHLAQTLELKINDQ